MLYGVHGIQDPLVEPIESKYLWAIDYLSRVTIHQLDGLRQYQNVRPYWLHAPLHQYDPHLVVESVHWQLLIAHVQWFLEDKSRPLVEFASHDNSYR